MARGDIQKIKAKELFPKVMKIIKNKKPIFIEDLVVLSGVSKSTFYDYYPADSEEMHAIKEAITDIKIEQKMKLRNKWADSDNATLNVALYKLISNEKERALLADRQDVNIDGEVRTNIMGSITKVISDNGEKKEEKIVFDIGGDVKDDKLD